MRPQALLGWAALITTVAFAPSAGAVELAGPIQPAHLELTGVKLHFEEDESLSNPFGLDAAGDVNGDGLEDVVIGSGGADPLGRRDAGSAYVIFGSRERRAIGLEGLAQADGFRIDGPPPALPVEFDDSGPIGEGVGTSVAGVGDVNGDGLADVALGAPTSSARYRALAGAVYVVFGKRDSTPVDLASAEPWGYRIDGDKPLDFLGGTLAGTGDANGDGAGDLVTSGFTPHAYVVFGRGAGEPTDTRALGAGGYALDLRGVAPSDDGNNEFDRTLAAGGDLDADGRADTLVGIPRAKGGKGAVFAVYGSERTETVPVRALGERGIRVDGRFGSLFGAAAAGVGDMNGDGRDDFAVGAPEETPGLERREDLVDEPLPPGAAYVLLSPDGPGRIGIDGAAGVVRISGALPGDRAGTAVDGIGDVDGDGFPDLLVGAPTRDLGCASDTGAVYVVHGRGPGLVRLRGIQRPEGFRVWGARRYEGLGAPLRGLSDVTGDGVPELLAGAAGAPRSEGRRPRAFLASAARPGRARPETPPASCLRVRLPRPRLARVVKTGRIRIGVTAREAGAVDLSVSDRAAPDSESEVVGMRLIRFRRAGSRSIALKISRSARRRFARRDRVRLVVEATQFGGPAKDVRHVERALVLR